MKTLTQIYTVPLLLILSVSTAGCMKSAPAKPRQATTKNFTVTLQTSPDPIPVNEHFTMEFTVTAIASGMKIPEQIVVNADMPSHGHGMNTKPRLTALGNNRWKVEGMLFHMPGAWEIYVYIGSNAAMERAAFPVNL